MVPSLTPDPRDRGSGPTGSRSATGCSTPRRSPGRSTGASVPPGRGTAHRSPRGNRHAEAWLAGVGRGIGGPRVRDLSDADATFAILNEHDRAARLVTSPPATSPGKLRHGVSYPLATCRACTCSTSVGELPLLRGRPRSGCGQTAPTRSPYLQSWLVASYSGIRTNPSLPSARPILDEMADAVPGTIGRRGHLETSTPPLVDRVLLDLAIVRSLRSRKQVHLPVLADLRSDPGLAHLDHASIEGSAELRVSSLQLGSIGLGNTASAVQWCIGWPRPRSV